MISASEWTAADAGANVTKLGLCGASVGPCVSEAVSEEFERAMATGLYATVNTGLGMAVSVGDACAAPSVTIANELWRRNAPF